MSDDRQRRVTLVLLLMWSWVVMTLTHELGHVVAGLAGGAQLTELELRPWHLPHSIFAGDAHPLITLWAGPLLGCAVPLLVACIARRPSIWLIAWFCVVANGAYLLLGYFSGDAELDSTKMLKAGTSPMLLSIVSAAMLILGYVRFRRACIDLMSGKTESLSRSDATASFVALIVVLVAQGAMGALVR